MSARHILNIANDVVNDPQFMHFFFRRSRYGYLLATKFDLDGAL